MNMRFQPCPVEGDLFAELQHQDRDEMRRLAREHEAEMLIYDNDAWPALGDGFTEALYGAGVPDEALAEFHAEVARSILRLAFEHDAEFCQRAPALARFARQWINTSAEARRMRERP